MAQVQENKVPDIMEIKMYKNTTLILILTVLALSVGCTGNTKPENSQTVDAKQRLSNIEAEIQAMIDDADKSRKKAASVKSEWRDTNKFIKQARKDLAAGKYESAIKLAKKAQREGELGYQQAMNQKESFMPGYFKF